MYDPNVDASYNAQIEQAQQNGEGYLGEGTMQLSQMQSQDSRVVLEILNLPRLMLQDLGHDLKGEELNMEKGIWETKNIPTMKAIGVNTIISLLKPVINPMNALSYYDEDRIMRLCKEFAIDFDILIYLHYKEWGVDLRDRTFIVKRVAQLHESILRMSLRGKYMTSLSSSLQTKEISRFGGGQEQGQGGGFMSRFGRRFNKLGV